MTVATAPLSTIDRLYASSRFEVVLQAVTFDGSGSDVAGGYVYATGQAVTRVGLDDPTVNLALSVTSFALDLADLSDCE